MNNLNLSQNTCNLIGTIINSLDDPSITCDPSNIQEKDIINLMAIIKFATEQEEESIKTLLN